MQNNNKKRVDKTSKDKIEVAKQIANQRKRVTDTFESVESSIIRSFRWISGWVDRLLFNQRYSKVVAVVLAVLIYSFAYYGEGSLLDASIRPSLRIDNINLEVNVDTEIYEVSGLPTTVSATIFGDSADIQAVRNKGSHHAVADLTGKTEGQHQIQIIPVDFSSKVRVEFSPSTVVVTIRKKVSSKFTLSHDFVNVNKMDQMYALGEPEFANTEVLVKASQETVDQIAYVKALIDVTGRTSTFEVEAPILAYNAEGERVMVDLLPSIVKVKVPVSSPNKAVAVVVNPVGEIPNNMAIDSIVLDHASITLYASESVLAKYHEIKVNIDATKLTSSSDFTQNIELPSGIRKASVSKINMKINLKPAVTRVIENVPIMVDNNVNGYKFAFEDINAATINVTVVGTEDHVKNITAENIGRVYIDMQNVGLGQQNLPIYIDGNDNLVTYTPSQKELAANVVEGD